MACGIVFCVQLALSTDRGTTYEFRVSGKNDVDYGERAVTAIKTPDGGLRCDPCWLVCNQ